MAANERELRNCRNIYDPLMVGWEDAWSDYKMVITNRVSQANENWGHCEGDYKRTTLKNNAKICIINSSKLVFHNADDGIYEWMLVVEEDKKKKRKKSQTVQYIGKTECESDTSLAARIMKHTRDPGSAVYKHLEDVFKQHYGERWMAVRVAKLRKPYPTALAMEKAVLKEYEYPWNIKNNLN